MTGRALALVLGAAVLHAAWNALAKRGRDPLCFLWASFSAATLLLLPLAVWWLRDGGVSALRGAAPYLAATCSVHSIYFYALGSSYRSASFSHVYPIARGLGVALVPVLAFLLLDERLSLLGVVGVGLVVLGILALHRLRRTDARPADGSGCGTAWAVLTGLTISAYSLVDKAGVARLHPVPYIAVLGLGAMTLLTPAIVNRRAALRHEVQESWRAILVASTMNLTAYLLVLFAFQISKAGYVVAGRELSIVLSAIIGSVWLGEGAILPRLLASTVVLAGVSCVVLAR
jgi:drug/metabolite transporter (DMT)-like permease